MKLQELVAYLDDYLECSRISDYCPNGLQIEGKEKIKKIATAVSADLQTIEKAAQSDVDALIVHHGIFWDKDPYPVTGSKKAKLELLLKKGISLLAYHLPLDMHQEVGNNWFVAKSLGWRHLEPFGFFNGMQIGVKGTFKPLAIEALIALIEAFYGHSATVAPWGKKKVQSAALVSGGAYKEIKQAISENLDCYITGNFDEPAWSLAQEGNIHFLALGHTATEKIGPKALAEHLKIKFQLNAFFIDTENPF